MTVVRRIYPEELEQHICDEIWSTQKAALDLKVCEVGMLLDYPEASPLSIVPAVLVDLVEDGTELDQQKVPLQHVDVEYMLEIHYIRAMQPGDRPKKNLYKPAKALREFFLRDKADLPLFQMSGHQILSAIPGRCVYAPPYEPDELKGQGHLIEQAMFRLLVKARSLPVPL